MSSFSWGRRLEWVCVPLMLAGSSGCVVSGLSNAERMKNGLLIVLPGIEGRSKYNADIAKGLAEGGVPCAIEVFDWSTGMPLVNLVALERNRRQAELIAERVVRYQQDYPGRPIHLVGHSGGGGLAILTLEALPPGTTVTSAVLLAAAISPRHNLTRALERTDKGIWNFYSSGDIGYLQVGTGLFGTIDREHTRAAGAVDFERPTTASQRTMRAYEKLHSVRYKSAMANTGNRGGHGGWTSHNFVAVWLAPVILAAGDGRPGYMIALDDRYNRLVGQNDAEHQPDHSK
jgi:pimeloyl-ACP methyl ester carboxylesterase